MGRNRHDSRRVRISKNPSPSDDLSVSSSPSQRAPRPKGRAPPPAHSFLKKRPTQSVPTNISVPSSPSPASSEYDTLAENALGELGSGKSILDMTPPSTPTKRSIKGAPPLPMEIIEIILEYLPTTGRQEMLWAVCGVCRMWYWAGIGRL